MEPISDALEETIERVNRLRSRYDTLKRRLRRAEGVDEMERLDTTIQRRRSRIEHLDTQIDQLMQERDRLKGEVLGCFHGAEALLRDIIERFEALEGPSWSPNPIPGYSMLDTTAGVIHDGDHVWTERVLRPGCPSDRPSAPHDRAECAERPCGVLAWKSVDDLPPLSGDMLRAVVEIALSGRVIEHTAGYRAEVAEISGIIAFDGSRWFRSRDRSQIASFVESPTETFDLLSAPIPADTMMLVEVDLFFGTGR